jgi:hypothetical protein
MTYTDHRFELWMVVIYGACCFGMGLAIGMAWSRGFGI